MSKYEYKPYKQTLGLAIDWETSGSDFDGCSSDQYQGISFGAVVFDLKTFEVSDELYCEVKFDGSKYKWSDVAEQIHGLSREHLEKYGVSTEEAAIQLASFVFKHFGPSDKWNKVLFLGHNAGFDIDFTKQLLVPLDIMFDIAITILDTSSLGFFTIGLHKSNDIFNYLDLPERKKHNALEDVKMEVEAAKRIRMLVDVALGKL